MEFVGLLAVAVDLRLRGELGCFVNHAEDVGFDPLRVFVKYIMQWKELMVLLIQYRKVIANEIVLHVIIACK